MTTDVTFGPYQVAEWFLAASLGDLAACGSDPITTAYVGAGLAPWDDCCGQLVVTPESMFRSSAFPAESATDDHCDGATIAIGIVATLVRCVPTLSDSGKGPSAEQINVAHKKVLDDAAIMWRAFTSPMPVENEWDRAQVRQVIIDTTGGCVAIETRCIIGVESSRWCVNCS